MNICIFGTGYVGLVTGACLADSGHNVFCIDIDQSKIDRLNKGIIPIYEPGLGELVKRNLSTKRIHFSTDSTQAIEESEVVMIAVGTPPSKDGSAELKQVLAVAKEIAEKMDDPKVIVTKSTVPVGTAELIKESIEKILKKNSKDISFYLASNPEFLKEGDAVNDFMKPDRIIIGCEEELSERKLKEIYAPFNRNHDRCVVMDIKSAELTKYASNAMLATKISFMNELSQIAERVGADIENVRVGIGSDSRIGYSFIYPGIGYGGSCFPKDIKALSKTSKDYGYESKILEAVKKVNKEQRKSFIDKIVKHFKGSLSGLTLGIWGLSFKPKTDDIREAPSVEVINSLLDLGAKIKAYDPMAMENFKDLNHKSSGMTFHKTKYSVLKDSDALIILTEWKDFWNPDFNKITELLKSPVIFDGRNLYNPSDLKEKGLTYYGIGRGESVNK